VPPRKHPFALILVVGLVIQSGVPGFVFACDSVNDGRLAPADETGATDKSTGEGDDSATLVEAAPAFGAYDRAVRSDPVPVDGSEFGTTVYRPPMTV